MKEIKDKLDDEENDSETLDKMSKEMNIETEIENYKNKIYGFPDSPKLVKARTHKIIQNGMEYIEKEDDSDNFISEEFNKWLSIESVLMT